MNYWYFNCYPLILYFLECFESYYYILMSVFEFSMQLPYTCLVTKLRMSKRQSETQMAEILKQIINLKNSSQIKSRQEVADQLKKSRQKLELLKQKLKLQKQQQDEIYNICRKRVHLDQDAVQKKKQPSKQQMLDEFNKQVLQYFACRNKLKQARAVQKTLKDNYYFQLYVDLYQKAYRISEAISKNDLRPLKDWCYEHSHFLTKMKSSLQFKLISCLFVNILNNKNAVKAVEFLRKQIATLTLSEKDQQELDKLTFKVLLAENQEDYYYYSDSQKQKEKQKPLKKNQQLKNDENKKEIGQKKQARNQDQNSNSSSSSVEEALVANQQQMRQIFRAFEQIVDGVNTIITRAVGTITQGVQISQERFEILQPQDIDIPQVLNQDSIEQQIYEDKFDSMSEQGEHQKKQLKKQSNKKQEIVQNTQLLKEQKQISQKNGLKETKKQIKRKHKLDKNNLRDLLIQTRQEFMLSFAKIYKISFNSFFDKTLAVGISVIKTSSCSELHGHELGSEKGYCPVCTSDIQRICKNVPATLKNQSSLICRITGSLMNQVNYPIAMPNGQVYSLEGLQRGQKNGKYFCLAQKKWFRKQICKKVFLT